MRINESPTLPCYLNNSVHPTQNSQPDSTVTGLAVQMLSGMKHIEPHIHLQVNEDIYLEPKPLLPSEYIPFSGWIKPCTIIKATAEDIKTDIHLVCSVDGDEKTIPCSKVSLARCQQFKELFEIQENFESADDKINKLYLTPSLCERFSFDIFSLVIDSMHAWNTHFHLKIMGFNDLLKIFDCANFFNATGLKSRAFSLLAKKVELDTFPLLLEVFDAEDMIGHQYLIDLGVWLLKKNHPPYRNFDSESFKDILLLAYFSKIEDKSIFLQTFLERIFTGIKSKICQENIQEYIRCVELTRELLPEELLNALQACAPPVLKQTHPVGL